jgi:predicted nucleic acid-binding protein
VLVVIADTGPINYLILSELIDVLPALFGKVILPAVVRDELDAVTKMSERVGIPAQTSIPV